MTPTALDNFGLPAIFGLLIGVSLWVYALTGGADFGGGVWDLFASGPRRSAQREAIANAIGPIWEANHVWLILAVVLLFVAFPDGFAVIMTALHVPVVLMLVGITLRGAAFVFRSYGPKTSSWRHWGTVFAVSSAVTPIFLGVVLGVIISGRLRIDSQRQVITDFVSEWWTPFPWALGLMVLALFAYLAAVYLAVETSEPSSGPAETTELSEDFRRRAIIANAAFGLFAGVAALTAHSGAPHLFSILAGSARAWLMQGVTALVALGALASLLLRRFRWARALAMAQVTLVWLAWLTSQAGWVFVGSLSLEDAAAPPTFLRPALLVLGVGAVILLPSFFVLYRVFKGKRLST